MKQIIFLLSMILFFAMGSDAQMRVSTDSSTVFKDTLGNIVTNEKFGEILQAGHGRLQPDPVIENGVMKEMRMKVVTKEEQAKMMERMMERTNNLDALKGKKAPEFEGKDLDNKNVKLSDLKGKVVVVKFWFTQCKPCLMEMPELNKMIEEKYKNNKDVVFISICLDNKEAIKKTLGKHPFSYSTLYNMQETADKYKVVAYPTHLVIDKSGIVTLASNEGMRPLLESAIDKALEGK
jgi:peroxiredoxin